MSEVAEVEQTTESSVEAEAPQTTPDADIATWRKRLAGKDQALTATQQERDRLKAELDSLAKWKAEKEGAELTEVQRLQQERDNLRAEAERAKAEAAAVRLKAAYPLAAELLGDDLTKFEEARVAEIDGRLKSEAESEPEPRIDANSPRRPAGKPSSERTRDDIVREIAAAGKQQFGW